ncbi:30S ribosomal protein S6 [Desulfovibrio aminophilus]|nr:30S ribosomal protein S6 [Desulfovibrio aminophilus]MCM0754166.1 30S ribosomal protein S6 [Desulfovibrio aminophilus]
MSQTYETLVLLSPELAEENRKTLIDNLSAIVDREGGKVNVVDDWGIRTLAYPVQKQTRGYYVRLEYAGPGPLVAELERNIRITDGIFKFVTVRLSDTTAA